MHVTRDVHFDEKNIYNRKGLTPCDFEEEEWAPNNDDLFVNPITLISNGDTPDPWDLPIPKPVPHSIYSMPPATPPGGANGDNNDDNEEEPGIFESIEYVTLEESTIQGEQFSEPPPLPSKEADNLNENVISRCRKAEATTSSEPICHSEQIAERIAESSQESTEYYP